MCLMVYYKYINSIRGTLDKGEYLSKSIIIGVSTIEIVIIISYAQKPPTLYKRPSSEENSNRGPGRFLKSLPFMEMGGPLIEA